VEALCEMRNRHPEIEFDDALIEAALIRGADGSAGTQGGAEADDRLRTTIGLLALIYPSDDIYRAYAGLRSDEREPRANAVELLDNLLRPEIKKAVLPGIEAWSASTAANQ